MVGSNFQINAGGKGLNQATAIAKLGGNVLFLGAVGKDNNGTKVVLNPAPFKKMPDEVYRLVDYLVPNEHEAESLTGICIDSKASAIKAIEKIKLLGVKDVVITLGDRGCVYTDGDQVVFFPAENVTAVDTTSAGDCFIGALVTVLSQNKPISEAITFATKAAAITITREGASKSIPTADEIE